jgi:hypothetical protein
VLGRLQRWFPLLAGVLMIMAVVVINGRPSVFTDTDDYFVEGRTFAYTIAYTLHIKTPPPPPTCACRIRRSAPGRPITGCFSM